MEIVAWLKTRILRNKFFPRTDAVLPLQAKKVKSMTYQTNFDATTLRTRIVVYVRLLFLPQKFCQLYVIRALYVYQILEFKKEKY